MTISTSLLAAGTMICVLLLLIAEQQQKGRYTVLFKVLLKPLASLGFLSAAVSAGALDSSFGRTVFAGLLLCALGDVCLLGRGNKAFLAGLGAFLAGHLAFALSFLLQPQDTSACVVAAALLSLLLVVVHRWLSPHLKPKMKAPVAAYMLTIALMVMLAAGAVMAGARPALLVGAVMFLVSDLAVARDRFIAPGLINRLWGLPLYYAAQLVLAGATTPA